MCKRRISFGEFLSILLQKEGVLFTTFFYRKITLEEFCQKSAYGQHCDVDDDTVNVREKEGIDLIQKILSEANEA